MYNNQIFPKIYCINLEESVARKRRMINRFTHHKIMDRAVFVKAISRDSSIIDYYHQNINDLSEVRPGYSERKWKSEMGCFASHLKAIRSFLEDGCDECLIAEDDIIFHNNFVERYWQIRNNMFDDTTLISLSYMIEKYEDYGYSGKNPALENICILNPLYTWGGQLYWISKKYAIEVLTKYDKPFKDIMNSQQHTCEIIHRNSKGYIAYPLLAIEEGIDSERAQEDIVYHHNHFGSWGFNNFNESEKLHLNGIDRSPLRDKLF